MGWQECFLGIKKTRQERKITGYFHNMLPRWIHGKQDRFCIIKNVWDTEWPLVKAKETRLCVHFNQKCCSVDDCPKKIAHDEYMKLKSDLENLIQQKVK